MSEQIKDGGPAFPAKVSVNRDTGDTQPYQFGNNDFYVGGMNLRDYFAAKATDADVEAARFGHEDPEDPGVRCRARFRHADAMLAAREAKS